MVLPSNARQREHCGENFWKNREKDWQKPHDKSADGILLPGWRCSGKIETKVEKHWNFVFEPRLSWDRPWHNKVPGKGFHCLCHQIRHEWTENVGQNHAIQFIQLERFFEKLWESHDNNHVQRLQQRLLRGQFYNQAFWHHRPFCHLPAWFDPGLEQSYFLQGALLDTI